MNYEFRKLTAKDSFKVSKVISKIGVSEFGKIFESKEIQALMTSGKNNKNINQVVGLQVIMKMADVIFANMDKCEEDIFELLSSTSNLSVKEIESMEMQDFIEMVVSFVKQEQFKQVFSQASQFLK